MILKGRPGDGRSRFIITTWVHPDLPKKTAGPVQRHPLFCIDRSPEESGEMTESADPHLSACLTMVGAPLTLCSLSYEVAFSLSS